MSCTPEEQRLSKALVALGDAISDVRARCNARLDETPNTWSSEHLDELVALVRDLAPLGRRVRRLSEETR